MDRAWAAKQLGIFQTLIDALYDYDENSQHVGDHEELATLDMPYQATVDRLVVTTL